MGEIADYQSLPIVDRILCIEVPTTMNAKAVGKQCFHGYFSP